MTVDARSILARQSSSLHPTSHQRWGSAVPSMPGPCPLRAPLPAASGHLVRRVAAPALSSCPTSPRSVFSPQHHPRCRPGPAPSPAPAPWKGTNPRPGSPRRLPRLTPLAPAAAPAPPRSPRTQRVPGAASPLLGQRLPAGVALPLAPDQQPAQESACPGDRGAGAGEPG